MFTGIIEEMGEVVSIHRQGEAFKLTVRAEAIMEDIKLGDSISSNGVCLTVNEMGKQTFTADVMPETLRRSNLRYLRPTNQINLESALKLSDRLGGHLVAGHVDGMGKVISRHQEGNAEIYRFQIVEQEKPLDRYLVEKGSIAVDGMSLTLFNCDQNHFSVSIVPHTRLKTVIDKRKVGDYVNIEVDMIGKYVEKLLMQGTGIKQDDEEAGNSSEKKSGLDIEKLRDMGY